MLHTPTVRECREETSPVVHTWDPKAHPAQHIENHSMRTLRIENHSMRTLRIEKHSIRSLRIGKHSMRTLRNLLATLSKITPPPHVVHTRKPIVRYPIEIHRTEEHYLCTHLGYTIKLIEKVIGIENIFNDLSAINYEIVFELN